MVRVAAAAGAAVVRAAAVVVPAAGRAAMAAGETRANHAPQRGGADANDRALGEHNVPSERYEQQAQMRSKSNAVTLACCDSNCEPNGAAERSRFSAAPASAPRKTRGCGCCVEWARWTMQDRQLPRGPSWCGKGKSIAATLGQVDRYAWARTTRAATAARPIEPTIDVNAVAPSTEAAPDARVDDTPTALAALDAELATLKDLRACQHGRARRTRTIRSMAAQPRCRRRWKGT